jgi:VanZ family protein
MLCVMFLALVVYGTLGPLGLRRGPWIVSVANWQWIPPLRPSDVNDILTNFAVYVPVGIALRLLVRRRGATGWPDFLSSVTLSVALSYATEVLQQAMPTRVSSLTDTLVNGSAALVGSLCAVSAQRGLRRLHVLVFLLLRGTTRSPGAATWLPAAAFALLVVLSAYTANVAWSHRLSRSAARAQPVVAWVPFDAHFRVSFPNMAWDIARKTALFAILTLLCLVATAGWGRGLALLLLLSLVVLVEICRAFVGRGGAETTLPLLAIAGWVLTTRVWAALYPPTRTIRTLSDPVVDRATSADAGRPDPSP